MIVLASNPQKMKFKILILIQKLEYNRSPDPIRFVQNVLTPAGLET